MAEDLWVHDDGTWTHEWYDVVSGRMCYAWVWYNCGLLLVRRTDEYPELLPRNWCLL